MFKGNVLFVFVRLGRGVVHFHFNIRISSSDALRRKVAHMKVQKHNILRNNHWEEDPDSWPDSECSSASNTTCT